jgi:predicted membrane chloride channel (bestrophin family)
MKTGPFLIQARDAAYLTSLYTHNEQLEELLYMGIREKFKAVGQPTATTVLSIDSVKIGTLIFLSNTLRYSAYWGAKNVYNRINVAIRACNNAFLQRYLNRLDEKEENDYKAILEAGKKTLLKQY